MSFFLYVLRFGRLTWGKENKRFNLGIRMKGNEQLPPLKNTLVSKPCSIRLLLILLLIRLGGGRRNISLDK